MHEQKLKLQDSTIQIILDKADLVSQEEIQCTHKPKFELAKHVPQPDLKRDIELTLKAKTGAIQEYYFPTFHFSS